MSYIPVTHIESLFAGCRQVRKLALEGLSAAEIAANLQWRTRDVRAAAKMMGFTISDLARRYELCPVCGHILMPDRHCEVCALRLRLERLIAVNAEEHRREVERLEREIDAVKQDTKRVRMKLGTNPRKRY